jgi:uncharacterized membrane protein YdjX (TVP38/TMEM64 family)
MAESESPPLNTVGRFATRLVLLGLAVAAACGIYWGLGDSWTLDNLAHREAKLRALGQRHPLLVYGVAFVLYVGVTGLSLPGATPLSLAYGWYFGVIRGVVLVSFASTSGATLAFLLSRFLFRDAIRRYFGDRLERFNAALKREGPFYLFLLRLVPAFPFFVINVVMGLTPLRVWTFWWVSQLGMFPGTVVYLYAGSTIPNLQQLSEQGLRAVFSPSQLVQIITAFTLLGFFPLVARWTISRFLNREARLG